MRWPKLFTCSDKYIQSFIAFQVFCRRKDFFALNLNSKFLGKTYLSQSETKSNRFSIFDNKCLFMSTLSAKTLSVFLFLKTKALKTNEFFIHFFRSSIIPLKELYQFAISVSILISHDAQNNAFADNQSMIS